MGALQAVGVLVASILGYYLCRGYQVRKMYQDLARQGIPLMKHSMILGHLEIIGKLLADMPSDSHGDYMMVKIQENWQSLFPNCKECPPVLYIDLWPFTAPIVISINADISTQFTQDYSLPKAWQQKHILYPLTHNRDLSSMEGAEWKVWKKRLSPGFSIQNITTRIPDIIEEVGDFVDILKARSGRDGAWGPVFQLEEATTGLALDVILRFFLNRRFNEQTKRSQLCAALIDSIIRSNFFVNIGNIVSYMNPWRHFKLWQNYRVMSAAIQPFFQERLAEMSRNQGGSNKTLVDLIVNSIRDEEKGNVTPDSLMHDPAFLEVAVGQVTTFMFAGHDTTASTLCWVFRVLSQYPEVLERMRAEHDTVLGNDTRQAATTLTSNPHLLNSLTYTNAVIKEVMRVHTNVGTMRRGEPGFFFLGPAGTPWEGVRMPTDGFVVWDGTFAIHRDPKLWHRVDEFLPERFLATDENDPLRPTKDAWRFFSMGPRNCIGQHLAMIEIKLVMALVVRQFDIECAWDEWDSQRNFKGKPQTVWGDRCYQVKLGDSPPHVKDGMPVHVRTRHT